jgi:gluconolactonase
MLAVLLALLIVPPDAKLETIFDGGVFTEGPAAAPDGSIYFSDITGSARSREAGHIMRYDPRTSRVTVFRSPSGMANGMIFDLEGRLVVTEGADYGGRRISRIDLATGKSERLALRFRNKPFNSPNDVTIDRRGRIYFTDPRYVGDEPIEQPVQAVYRLDPDGTVARIIADASKPNGIAISPDQKSLYVAATDSGAFGAVGDGLSVSSGRMAILAYDLNADGSARFRKQLVDLAGRGYADGLTVDRAGNIYCGCGPLGVRVFSPEGEEIAAIPIPAETTNVEFGRGADKNLLYVTAGKGLYRIRLNAEGFHPAD